MRLIHKYLRRVIRWINKPSEEERSARNRLEYERLKETQSERRYNLKRRVLKSLVYPPLPADYIGISRNDLAFAIDTIKATSGYGLFPDENVQQHIAMAEKFRVLSEKIDEIAA